MRGFGFLAAGVLLLSGCGEPAREGDPVVTVNGTVTLDGQPVPYGNVTFLDPAEEHPRRYVAPIEHGGFQCDVAPGSFRVEVSWPEEQGDDEEGVGVGLPVQRIPARYNVESELTAELKLGEPPALSFDLKSD